MNIVWHLITDDIMEQIELKRYIPDEYYACSIIPPEISTIEHGKQICFIINVHASSYDAISFLRDFKNITYDSPIEIIAYTSEMHDHQTIHIVKSMGIQHMCTKTQLMSFLQSVFNKEIPD